MSIEVRNPRSGVIDYIIKSPDHNALQSIASAMRSHQSTWYDAGVSHRAIVMNVWKENLIKHKEQIIDALTHDTGRYAESVLEFNLLPSTIDRWIQWSTEFFNQPRDKKSQMPNIAIKQGFVPYELVAVISPWNFPLLLSIIDTIPALMAGCAVIVKPSEITPRFIEVIQRTIDMTPALKDVLKYVAGDGTTGSTLVAMSDITCFTGSVATGKKVYQQAAQLFKPVFLELGGKDAALVLEGANLEYAAKSILWGSTVNCGHSCLSIERVYVQRNIFNQFIRLLENQISLISLASEDPKSGQIGPVISARQADIINDHLTDALDKGAHMVIGNTHCQTINGGLYCAPTLLTNVNHSMKIMTEETFGPIIPVMPFDTVDQGIELANDTIFGLSGAVFAKTNDLALAVAQQLKAGAISINESALTALVHDGEKNSFKYSGIGGTRMGPASLQRFLRKKAYLINENINPSPWWF